MSKPKKHHYVPECLLKHFLDQDGKIHIDDCSADRARERHGVPSKQFTKSKLYSLLGPDGTHEPIYELRLTNEVETPASPVIDKLIRAARGGAYPHLSAREKRRLTKFVAVQWIRTPEMMDKFLPKHEFNENWDREILAYELMLGPVSHQKKEHVLSNAMKERAYHNMVAQSVFQNLEDLTIPLSSLTMVVCLADEPAFVTGSCPVVMFSVLGSELGGEGFSIALAIASDVVISFSPETCIQKLCSVSRSEAARLNSIVARQSTIIGGCSRELLAAARNDQK